MKYFFVCLAFVIATHLNAQDTGSIVGKLTDKELNNEPLAFANVLIKGTTKGTTSDFDGLYEIPNLEPGTYTVVFSYLGYETIEIPNVEVVAGKVTTINAPMSASEGVSLDEVVVTTVARKDSEVALLLDQKKAVGIKTSIGAQELARKGVGDAEAAVTKVSGVSKQEGVKNVFVRGLGDRYNATTFNGMPLPSEDPEYKNISLDFFASDIIESVGIDKTYLSSQYGDMGGAIIDIQSKELTGQDIFQISAGTGINSIVADRDFLIMDEGNWFGTVDERLNTITGLDSYGFNNSFGVENQNLQMNTSLGFQFGKRFNLGENNKLSVFLTGSLNSDYAYQEGDAKVINAQGGFTADYRFSKYIYETSKLLMGSLKYDFGARASIAYNALLVHSNGQEIGDFFGFAANISEEADAAFIRRQQQNEDVLFVNQLLSEFAISENLNVDLGVSYNTTRGYEPDRRTNTYTFNENAFRPALGSPGLTNRFYSDLEEDDLAAKAGISYDLGSQANEDKEGWGGTVTLGGDYRQTDRVFNFTQFNFDFRRPVVVDITNPDGVFNQQSLDQEIFRLVTNRGTNSVDADPLSPFFYEGDRTIYAGFINGDFILNNKFSFGLGLRFENVNQFVEWDTNISSSVDDLNTDPSEIDENYFLPSLNTKYNFNENSILRLAASRTYTFPQFKELAPFLYEDVTFSSVGFEGLIPSTNYNVDLKYEYYFSAGEIISFTGFYKIIEDPINRIAINSAANNLSYRNTGDEATVAGVELEFRKDIFSQESDVDEGTIRIKKLSAGLNASYLYSNQILDDVRSQANFTDDETELEGASPVLINADLTYNYERGNKWDLTSSLVFNYFSDRIYSLGTQEQGNIVEKGIPTLDFVTRFKIGDHYGIGLSIRNILDPEYELNQDTIDGETIPIRTFEKGITTSISFNYSF